jgi:hypothetical protein
MPPSPPHDAIATGVMQYRPTRENHLRQLIIILVAAALIAYDLFLLNGYYFRLVLAESSSIWNAIEQFFLSMF